MSRTKAESKQISIPPVFSLEKEERSTESMSKKDIKNNEQGVVMVEAAIYFPIVICVVVSMLYLGLFYLQEAAINYQVQRVASYASKDSANPGYSTFPVSDGSEFEFNFSGDVPSAGQVQSYYNAYHSSPGALYRGIAGIFGAGSYDYESLLDRMVRNGLLFRFTVTPSVEVEKSLFGTSILASVEYTIPTPGAMRYLGLRDKMLIRSAAYSHAVNPADFVRNTDLAVDLVTFAADKLGVSGTLGNIISKAKTIINKVF